MENIYLERTMFWCDQTRDQVVQLTSILLSHNDWACHPHTCSSITKLYNLMLGKVRWCSVAWKVRHHTETRWNIHLHCVSKKEATWCLIITLANVDRFSVFHQLIHVKILYVCTQGLPSHLQYVATLPCESWKSRNVTDFDSILNKLLTCSWGHLEHLI